MWRTAIASRLPRGMRRVVRHWASPVLYALERPRLRRLYGSFVEPGSLAFDIGAAEGYHAAILLSLDARAVAVEPNPRSVAVLERRVAGRGAAVVRAAVAERSGQRVLRVSSSDPELSTLVTTEAHEGGREADPWDGEVDVTTVTLDQLIAEHGRPDFIKIDVEGAELEVLRGLSTAVERLSFEFHRCDLEAVGACTARLEQLGEYRFAFSFYRRFRLVPPLWVTADKLLERLRALTSRDACGDVYVCDSTALDGPVPDGLQSFDPSTRRNAKSPRGP